VSFEFIDRKFAARKPADIKLECERCAFLGTITTEGVQMENSRTTYHFEGIIGSPEDPNRPLPLCRSCAADHHAYWDSMWADAQNASNCL
jgi:hypothetical protein